MKTSGAYKFYPIVDSAEWVERLVNWGAKTIQLRIKNASPEAVTDQINRSVKLCANTDVQLIINDYWQEAITADATYVHLGQEDLKTANLSTIKQNGLKLGISTHSEEELSVALSHTPDYVALGPIYETTLKKMPWAPQGLDRIGEWQQKIDIPLVAIGGITLEQAPDVFAAGADSIAVVSDVVKNPDPQKCVEDWLSYVNKTEKAQRYA